jgi:hypothetical protein
MKLVKVAWSVKDAQRGLHHLKLQLYYTAMSDFSRNASEGGAALGYRF